MDDAPRIWISPVPSLDPDFEEVILALDHASTDPGERMVSVLLNRGHEGEEGVFYLLQEDLAARYERTGGQLAVSVLARRDLLTRDLDAHPEDLRERLLALPPDPVDGERVVLMRRALDTDFEPAERDGERQPVLLLDHVAGPASPATLLALFARGEAGLAVVRATGDRPLTDGPDTAARPGPQSFNA
ncbi:hypothetical protein ACIQNG_04895 [Streptomyces sp. NPDC091377]|uniref:hypothetical protein n=1 Tax=Streptomyces sp. NPDC091377 TaxID=3365995 RepID=UPI00381EF453